jgi:hypothetical protein
MSPKADRIYIGTGAGYQTPSQSDIVIGGSVASHAKRPFEIQCAARTYSSRRYSEA